MSSPAHKTRASVVRTAPERRYAVIACLIMLAILGSGLVLAATTGLPALFSWRGDQAGAPHQTTVVLPSDANRCRKLVIDNRTGRVSEAVIACKQDTAVDPNNVPPPQGTVRRLEAINKSFSKSN